MHRSIAAAALLVSLLPAASLFSQTCIGHRPLAEANVNASLNLRVMDGTSGPEARMNFGKTRGFGGFGVGLTNVGGGNRAFDIGLSAGGAAIQRTSYSICPVASYTRQGEVAGNARFPRTQEIALGVGIGFQKFLTPVVTLYPYAGAGVLRTQFNVNSFDETVGTRVLKHDGADVWAGVAAEFSRRFLVRTAIRHRDGLGPRSQIFTLGVTIAPDRK